MAVVIVKLGENIIQTHELGRDPVRIGRARDNDIVVENLSVSRHHCRIEFLGGQYVLIDNNSANGIFVNGSKVMRAELADNDIVSIGKHRLHFSVAGVAAQGDSPTSEFAEDSPIPPFPGADGSPMIAALSVIRGKDIDHVFPLTTVKSTIGRSHQNTVRIKDWLVSRVHAATFYKDGQFMLRDLGSWRGTTINAETIKEKTLREGDEILLGSTLMVFKYVSADAVQERTNFPVSEHPELHGIDLPFLPLSITQALGEEVTIAVPKPAAAKPSREDSVALEEEVDEFAPLTNTELESLEDDADLTFSDDEGAVAEAFQKAHAQKNGSLTDPDDAALRRMEESQFDKPEAAELIEDMELMGDEDVLRDDAEEEKSLFGGPVANLEPGSLDNTPTPGSSPLTPLPQAVRNTPAAPVAVLPKPSAPTPQATPGGLVRIPQSLNQIPVPAGVDEKVVQRWGHGLYNKSKVIRREAARKIKELTGIEYDWESGPTE
ncbi:MAG: FHA domain-containing protein [Candidatus Sumerlaeia bacterium]|nr:FHA domain-containing protein [Candidatus Sumerlaeia bacterium]